MCGSNLNYERRKPELTQLFQIIAEHWETFKAEREMEGRTMPKYVAEEFESFLRCGILAYGFGRIYCEACEHEKLVEGKNSHKKSWRVIGYWVWLMSAGNEEQHRSEKNQIFHERNLSVKGSHYLPYPGLASGLQVH